MHVPLETLFFFGLINYQKDLMHLTWNRKNWASLAAGPPPVGGAPVQQAVAPEAQKKEMEEMLLPFTQIY